MFLSDNSKKMIKEYLPCFETIKDVSDYFAALSDITRIKILTALLISEMSVSDISSILEMKQSTVSHQLKTLRSAKMVESQRKGKVRMYGLAAGVDRMLEQSYETFIK